MPIFGKIKPTAVLGRVLAWPLVSPALDLVGAYLDSASTAVTEMGGKVAKKLGDGLMALFGYPSRRRRTAWRRTATWPPQYRRQPWQPVHPE